MLTFLEKVLAGMIQGAEITKRENRQNSQDNTRNDTSERREIANGDHEGQGGEL
jgi:hypothetical protein